MLASFMLLSAAGSALAAPTVSLVVSGPRLGSIYFAGDTFTITVTGPANQPCNR